MLGKGFENQADEIFTLVVRNPQNHDARMGAGRIFARVGKVEILRDEEAIF